VQLENGRRVPKMVMNGLEYVVRLEMGCKGLRRVRNLYKKVENTRKCPKMGKNVRSVSKMRADAWGCVQVLVDGWQKSGTCRNT